VKRVEPVLDHTGAGLRSFEMTRVADPRRDGQRRNRKLIVHAVRNGDELRIEFSNQQQGRHVNEIEKPPCTLLSSGAHLSQAHRQTACAILHPTRSILCVVAQASEEGLGQPPIKKATDILGLFKLRRERFVANAALFARFVIENAWGSSDENQFSQASGLHHRRGHCHSGSHGVAQENKGFFADGIQEIMGRSDNVSLDIARATVARQINGHNGVMRTKGSTKCSPGRRSLGEAMTDHQTRARTPRSRRQFGHCS